MILFDFIVFKKRTTTNDFETKLKTEIPNITTKYMNNIMIITKNIRIYKIINQIGRYRTATGSLSDHIS